MRNWFTGEVAVPVWLFAMLIVGDAVAVVGVWL